MQRKSSPDARKKTQTMRNNGRSTNEFRLNNNQISVKPNNFNKTENAVNNSLIGNDDNIFDDGSYINLNKQPTGFQTLDPNSLSLYLQS